MTDTTIEQPKGLDAILESAISTHYEDDAPAPAPADDALKESSDDKAAAAEAAPQSDDRPRDERGRFVSAEAEHSDKGTAPAAASPAPATADPALSPIDPPQHLNAEQKAIFAKLPREAQQQLAQIEKGREGEYTRRSQEFAEFRRTADPLVQAVQPFNDYLAKIAPTLGQTPAGMIHAILAAEYQLRNGAPVQRYQAFAQLAQQYGVDLAALTSGQIPAQPQQPQSPPYNPELQQMRSELAQLRQWHESERSSQLIADFGNAKDEAGQPKYPHFERVRGVMASFLQAGQAETLEAAYDMAVKPIQDLIDQQLEARRKAAERDEADKKAELEKARKAAPVKTSTGALPHGTTERKGLEAHLNAALEKAGIH